MLMQHPRHSSSGFLFTWIAGYTFGMAIRIIKASITKAELAAIAKERYGDMAKAVVDVMQGVMAVGGEMHADLEVMLTEQEHSKREDTWGINLYPGKSGADWIEFDSMINVKPHYGNRSRDVESEEIRKEIRDVVAKLITD